MIEKEKIADLVKSSFKDDQMFLVEVKTTADNKIFVYVDSLVGVSLDTCAEINRMLVSQLDTESADFELQVSSAGIGNPFKVKEQYRKCIGKQINVLLKNGKKLKGTLLKVQENRIEIEIEKKVRLEGKKKKTSQIEVIEVNFEEIIKAMEIITF